MCSKPPDQIKFLKSIPVVLGKPQIHTHHCKFRHRRNGHLPAARLALQPQQPRYLGKFAETAETPAICFKLPISATTPQAAASTQFLPAAAIPAHSTIQCPPRGTHHFQAPSPLAQNGQENFRFPWDWQPQRPPASPPAAGKLTPPHRSALRRVRAYSNARTANPPPAHPSIAPPLP